MVEEIIKESKFKRFKRLFMENGCIRLGVYSLAFLSIFLLPIPVLLSYVILFLLCKTEYHAQMASYTDEIDYFDLLIHKRGELDQKIIDFIKNSFKKLKKKDKRKVEEKIIQNNNIQTIEEINNKLKEININGSIVRDPKEIAKEKEEYLSLLNILKQYQGTDNKEKIVYDTPVPTIEINDDYNKGPVYMKK